MNRYDGTITDHERLEFIHHVIQECINDNNDLPTLNENLDLPMLNTALEFVECLREPYLLKKGGNA